MVILGAGASHDCADANTATQVNNDFRPPLAKDIFSRRFDGILTRYPAVTARLDELRTQLGDNGNFERIFRTLLESAARHRKFWPLQIPLYLRELFWSISLDYVRGSSKFDTLVRQTLESSFEEVMFVNLNYDLFLENALENYDYHHFTDLDSYVPSAKKWRYVKPHGSVNWARLLENCPADSSGWFDPSQLQEMPALSPKLQLIMWNRHSGDFYIPRGGPAGYLYPQIVLPTDQPKNFTCPETHSDQARTFARNCQHFLAIGFSGRDDDVIDLFQDAPGDSHWLIVSKGDARTIAGRIASRVEGLKLQTTRWACYDRGFATFVRDNVIAQILGPEFNE